MTSIMGLSVPKFGISTSDITTPKNIALGGLAATSLVGGTVLGAMRGSPLKGLAIGGAIAAVALGASLVGNASRSYRDGFCDSWGDPDCDYPGVGPSPSYHGGDPGFVDHDHDGAREDYPDEPIFYPPNGTSYGDD